MAGDNLENSESQLKDVLRLRKGAEPALEQAPVNEQNWNQILKVLSQAEAKIAEIAETSGLLPADFAIEDKGLPQLTRTNDRLPEAKKEEYEASSKEKPELIAQKGDDPWWQGYDRKYGQYKDKVQTMGSHMQSKFEADRKAYESQSHNATDANQGWQGYEQKYGYLKNGSRFQALQLQAEQRLYNNQGLNQSLSRAQEAAASRGQDPGLALRQGIANFNSEMAAKDPEFAKGLRQQAKADAEARRLSGRQNYYDMRRIGR